MALAANRTGTVLEKCDRSNHKPETNKNCAVGICQRSLAEGERVPSTNELAAYYRINPATAAKGINLCLKEMPGRQAYLDFAVKVGAELPSRAREIAAERARAAKYSPT